MDADQLQFQQNANAAEFRKFFSLIPGNLAVEVTRDTWANVVTASRDESAALPDRIAACTIFAWRSDEDFQELNGCHCIGFFDQTNAYPPGLSTFTGWKIVNSILSSSGSEREAFFTTGVPLARLPLADQKAFFQIGGYQGTAFLSEDGYRSAAISFTITPIVSQTKKGKTLSTDLATSGAGNNPAKDTDQNLALDWKNPIPKSPAGELNYEKGELLRLKTFAFDAANQFHFFLSLPPGPRNRYIFVKGRFTKEQCMSIIDAMYKSSSAQLSLQSSRQICTDLINQARPLLRDFFAARTDSYSQLAFKLLGQHDGMNLKDLSTCFITSNYDEDLPIKVTFIGSLHAFSSADGMNSEFVLPLYNP